MYSIQYETHAGINTEMPFIFHGPTTRTTFRHPPNWHENLELFVCCEGEGCVYLDAEAVPIKAGDMVVVNPNVMHALATQTSMTTYYLIISNEFCTQNGVAVSKLSFRAHVRSAFLYKHTMETFDLIAEYQKSKKYYTLTAIRGKICLLLAELCEHHADDDPKKNSRFYEQEERIKKTIEYINENLTSEFTLQTLATQASVSKYYLTRSFKRLTAKTVFEYINTMRCKHAKDLLTNGYSVSEAAYSSGFNNMSYFTRKFKEVMGQPPSAYRTLSNHTDT